MKMKYIDQRQTIIARTGFSVSNHALSYMFTKITYMSVFEKFLYFDRAIV